MMKYIKIIFTVCCLFTLAACEFDEQFDPNNPSANSVLTDASIQELNLLVTGTEARMRNGYGGLVTASGSIARELYLFDADPRNTEDLLGKEGVSLDANTFYLTGPYNTRYRVIKNCNLLLEAIENTSSITAVEKQGYQGFANTIKGLMLLQVLDMLNDNGIRVDVADPENLGPFVNKGEAYSAIRQILDEGLSQLSGATFAFDLSSGFDGFDTPTTFAQFNRAIAARVAIHQEAYGAVQGLLDASFFDLNGDLDVGPKHVFSTSSGDLQNPVFRPLGQSGDQIIVHNDLIADAEAGDARLSKFALRSNPTSQDGLNGTHASAVYTNNTSPISIIRNEELILIYAEAKIQNDQFSDAVTALNIIRDKAGGLGGYTGDPNDKDALIDEMLHQRRYSLFSENHRMWDLRRYDRLNAANLPIDRPGDIIHTQFPIPLTEGQ